MGLLGLSLLGHVGFGRDRVALSAWLAQNSPHPAADLSCLARVVLSRRALLPVVSHRLPLDTLDGLLLVAHMTQHLILMSVVPPLLLLGAPAVPLLRALPRSALRDGLGPFFRTPVLHRVCPPADPSRLRMAGHEYRLPRLACAAGL